MNLHFTDCNNNTFLGVRVHDNVSGDHVFSDFFLTGKNMKFIIISHHVIQLAAICPLM